VSDAEVATGVTIRKIGPRVFAVEGQVLVIASQMTHAADRWEQSGTAGNSEVKRHANPAAADYSY
ncbi:hypothetical protein Tco_0476537, partial [Tanacetum coccineum]